MPIPLSDVAKVELTSGASFIYREGQERYIPIKFSVRGRDLGTTVLEAQKKVDEAVALPGGYHLEWVGEFGNLEEAIARLEVVVPLAIVLICLLLFLNFGSLVDMALAASVIPMALIGGIFTLWATGTAFSVSAAIGFVALFGIAAMDGIIVLTFYQLGRRKRPGPDRGDPAHLPDPDAAGADDLRGCRRRAAAGGAVERHRLPGAEAAGAGGGRRRHPGAGPDPDHPAGADRYFLKAKSG